MNNFYSNLSIYNISRDLSFPSYEELEALLGHYAFKPCGPNDAAMSGWFAPAPTGTMLHHPVGKGFMLKYRREEKIIPAAFVRKETDKRIAQIEAVEERELKRPEKRVIKDDVIISLIARAFTRTTDINMWVDIEGGRIWIDTSSAKRAEDALALLRKTLGSLPVVPLTLESPAELTMTEWLRAGSAPRSFSFGEAAEMKSLLDGGGVVRCKKVELNSDEIKTHLDAGRLATKLELGYIDRVSFVLSDDVTLARLKYADEMYDSNSDAEDVMARYDADMALMTAELAALLKSLVAVLGGEAHR